MQPDLRVTIRRDGVVRAVTWGPHLRLCGPTATLLEARDRAGVTLADLRILRDEEDGPATEVIVESLTGTVRPDAHRVLADWAALLGYRRVWLPGDVRTLDTVDHALAGCGGKVQTHCTTCRGRLADGTPAFWRWVRTLGFFPCACPLCGGDLPQWSAVPGVVRRASAPPAPGRGSATADVGVSDLRHPERP